MIDKKKCTEIADGIVINLKVMGLEHASIVTVKYEVNDTSYEISETVKLKSECIKLGFIPIGQRKVSRINSSVGSIVKVSYNPSNPQEAFLTENIGNINC